MKALKIIIGIVLLSVLYYFISIYLSKSGQFVHGHSSYSISKSMSKEKGLFLTDKINYNVIKDSAGIVKNSLDVWIDRMEITRIYGILPIEYTFENTKAKNLEIEFKDNIDPLLEQNMLITLNKGDKKDKYSILAIGLRNNADTIIHIDFYYNRHKNSFGSAEIIYNGG